MTILNNADAVKVGGTAADKLYLGANQVWSSAPAAPAYPQFNWSITSNWGGLYMDCAEFALYDTQGSRVYATSITCNRSGSSFTRLQDDSIASDARAYLNNCIWRFIFDTPVSIGSYSWASPGTTSHVPRSWSLIGVGADLSETTLDTQTDVAAIDVRTWHPTFTITY